MEGKKVKVNKKAVIVCAVIVVVILALVIALIAGLSKGSKKKNESAGGSTNTKIGAMLNNYEYIVYTYYGNEESNDLSLSISFKRDGSFGFMYRDGSLYKDYDLYTDYKYDDAKSQIVLSGFEVDDKTIEVKSWDEKELVINEEGKEIKFFVSAAYKKTDKSFSGSYKNVDDGSNSGSASTTTVTFSDGNKMEVKREYSSEGNTGFKTVTRYKYAVDTIYEKDCVFVDDHCEYYLVDDKLCDSTEISDFSVVYNKN